MGIDISGLSKACRVAKRHSDEICDKEDHYPVSNYRKLLDGLKSGCYVCDGKSFYLGITYIGFDNWRDALSLIVYGVPAQEVFDNPKRFKGRPFVELVTLPFTNNIGIGPTTSAKLYEDFTKHSARVKRGFQLLAAEAVSQRGKRKKHRPTLESDGSKAVKLIANAIGGVATMGDHDPNSINWEWKWKIYRDFRRAFKLACDDGIVLLSI